MAVDSSSMDRFSLEIGYLVAITLGLAACGRVLNDMTGRGLTFGLAIAEPGFLLTIACLALWIFLMLFKRLRLLQPLFFLALVPWVMYRQPGSIFGTGTFICAGMFLFRIGFFQKRRVLKIVLSLAYFYASEITVTVLSGRNLFGNLAGMSFSTMLFLFIYITYRDKVIVYLREPRPTLSLSGEGLTRTEAIYMRKLLAGSTLKQIAIDADVKESTVRNTMARVYRKLEVADRGALLAKCGVFDIVD